MQIFKDWKHPNSHTKQVFVYNHIVCSQELKYN
jgi:hypothetical protein